MRADILFAASNYPPPYPKLSRGRKPYFQNIRGAIELVLEELGARTKEQEPDKLELMTVTV